MAEFSGGCLCGAIRYEVNGDLIRALNCHCDDCRRATGASFGIFVFVNESYLKILQGTSKTFEHPNDAGIMMPVPEFDALSTIIGELRSSVVRPFQKFIELIGKAELIRKRLSCLR